MNQLQQCRYGIMMFPDHDVYVGRSLGLYGEWSEGEAILFRQLLRPGDIAFDIGAHVGSHTLCMARAVAPGGVLAFEPQRMLFYFLCGNVALNGLQNVHCHQLAVGAGPHTWQLPDVDYSLENNYGGLSLGTDFGPLPTYAVQQLRLDDVAVPHCRLIKADVEGMEREILEGGRALIARTRPLLYLEDDREDKSAPLHGLLHELGYRIYRHFVPLFNPDNFRACPDNHFERVRSVNLFCHPSELACPIDPLAFGMEAAA